MSNKNPQINLDTLSNDQLKALAYDKLGVRDLADRELQLIQQVLASRLAAPKEIINIKPKEKVKSKKK